MFKRSGVWWTCIRHDGRKIQKSLETSDRKLAQAIEAKIRTEIVEGSYFDKLAGHTKTFKDMMDKFMKEHAPKVSISMQDSYTTSLKNLDRFFGSSSLLPISPKMISRYKVLRREAGSAPGSINKELAMLSKAFSLAVMEWEWLKDNPVSKVPREKEDNEIDRWHDLRHTFATRLAQAGVDLYKISKLMGHKDIRITQRYAHHCSDSLRDGVDMLETDCNLTSMEKKRGSVACSNPS